MSSKKGRQPRRFKVVSSRKQLAFIKVTCMFTDFDNSNINDNLLNNYVCFITRYTKADWVGYLTFLLRLFYINFLPIHTFLFVVCYCRKCYVMVITGRICFLRELLFVFIQPIMFFITCYYIADSGSHNKYKINKKLINPGHLELINYKA